LDLSKMSLGNKAIVAICTALSHKECHANYKTINLESNRISGGIGAEAIAEMVSSHGACSELYLGSNDLRTHGATTIGKSLSSKESLIVVLDLSNNKIARDGIISLCKGIVDNTTLLKLNLSNNTFTHTSAPMLADMLSINQTLQVLDLSWNGIAGQGTINIFQSLRKRTLPPPKKKKKTKNKTKNKTKKMNLINDDSGDEEKEQVQHWNTSLRSLDLSWCGVGNKSMLVAEEVVDTLRQCKYNNTECCSLTHLNLSHNGLSNGNGQVSMVLGVGCWVLVVGCWLLVVGCWLLVVVFND
jgi:Ran GTPase-activating protein (RanGAP) involved in mRNA processing and transport